MGNPLKAIPQVITEDKKLADVLNALKYVIDVREGRGTADAGKMWVTFEDLTSALNKIPSLIMGALMETLTGTVEEGSIADTLNKIKDCSCAGSWLGCEETTFTTACDVMYNPPELIADVSSLTDKTNDLVINRIDSALVWINMKTSDSLWMGIIFNSEDPDCAGVMYGTFPITGEETARVRIVLPTWDNYPSSDAGEDTFDPKTSVAGNTLMVSRYWTDAFQNAFARAGVLTGNAATTTFAVYGRNAVPDEYKLADIEGVNYEYAECSQYVLCFEVSGVKYAMGVWIDSCYF